MIRKPITKQEVREKVRERAESITNLISPDDLILQDIENWSEADIDLLKQEIGSNLDEWDYMTTHPYESLIQELAVSLYMDDMTRIPFEDLNHEKYPNRNKCVREGYWLYDMSNDEVIDRIHENKEDIEYFHEYELEAQMFINSCVIDAQVQELEE